MDGTLTALALVCTLTPSAATSTAAANAAHLAAALKISSYPA